MSEPIDAIIKTRETTITIFSKSLENIENNSEITIAEKIFSGAKNRTNIFPEGWYSPPPYGIGVLLDQKPFERLKYDSLRNPDFWPRGSVKLEKESVGLIYFSPVDRGTNILGDVALTFYNGNDEEIKNHIKKSYQAMLHIAEHAKIGMSFSELSIFALDFLNKNRLKITKWKPISSNPDVAINIGHTIPGSFGDSFNFGNTFTEIKETIRIKRISATESENFTIPETCAFTIELRLESIDNASLPSVCFNFIVCFNAGKKMILENFDKIFKVVGMNYMNTK